MPEYFVLRPCNDNYILMIHKSKWASIVPFGEQAEASIRVNVLGTLALCKALFPLLRPYARVCNLSSSEGHLLKICGEEPAASALRSKLSSPALTEAGLVELMKQFVSDAKEGQHTKRGWPNSAYQVSKVGVAALTRIQQRDFDHDSRPGLLANCCHPGFIKTDLTSHLGTMTLQQGTVCPTYLALLPKDAKEPRGAYLWYDKQIVDWVNGPAPAPF
ncbi:hypothetical protein SK128_027670 [Halocaridina rubra]|uniref:Carbonyl reductase n=1 Tax=Halocaridina rubra TaxID=373956 RepID=A0AAN8WH41_HALRR